MAKRYNQKTKDEVVAFIQQYNEENGRGGQSAAAAKWKVNPITVKSWLEKAGVNTPGKSAKKRKKTASKAKVARKATTTSTNTPTDLLRRMVEIQKEIGSLQSEYDSLKGKL
ncbi:MAG: hypothetical protein AAF357_10720 [Verrucomicrobiota bacterium]